MFTVENNGGENDAPGTSKFGCPGPAPMQKDKNTSPRPLSIGISIATVNCFFY